MVSYSTSVSRVGTLPLRFCLLWFFLSVSGVDIISSTPDVSFVRSPSSTIRHLLAIYFICNALELPERSVLSLQRLPLYERGKSKCSLSTDLSCSPFLVSTLTSNLPRKPVTARGHPYSASPCPVTELRTTHHPFSSSQGLEFLHPVKRPQTLSLNWTGCYFSRYCRCVSFPQCISRTV